MFRLMGNILVKSISRNQILPICNSFIQLWVANFKQFCSKLGNIEELN